MTIDTFLNRELWWLEGNRPLLAKAQDPAPLLERLIVPDPHGRRAYVLLEDIIRMHLPTICAGYRIVSSHAIRVTRGANRPAPRRLPNGIRDIPESSRSRPRRTAVRLQLDAGVPSEILALLQTELGLSADDVYTGGASVAVSDLLYLHAALDAHPLLEPPVSRARAIGPLSTLTHRP